MPRPIERGGEQDAAVVGGEAGADFRRHRTAFGLERPGEARGVEDQAVVLAELGGVLRRRVACKIGGRGHQQPIVGAERDVDDAGEGQREGAHGHVVALLERVHRPVDQEELDRSRRGSRPRSW